MAMQISIVLEASLGHENRLWNISDGMEII